MRISDWSSDVCSSDLSIRSSPGCSTPPDPRRDVRRRGSCRGPRRRLGFGMRFRHEVGFMDVRDGFIGAIGNTPLIRLKRASEETGCEILGKAEFLNPGGSVKDRAALAIVRDAEEKGRLRPGGVIVEGTAGNHGLGLALVGNALGYRSVIVIPETQSEEKKDMLRLCGADLRQVH